MAQLSGMDVDAMEIIVRSLEVQLGTIDGVDRSVRSACGAFHANWLGPACGHLVSEVTHAHLPALSTFRQELERLAQELRRNVDDQVRQSSRLAAGVSDSGSSFSRVLHDAGHLADGVEGFASVSAAAIAGAIVHVSGYTKGSSTAVQRYVRYRAGTAPVLNRVTSASDAARMGAKLESVGKFAGPIAMATGSAVAGFDEWQKDQHSHLTDQQVERRVALVSEANLFGGVAGGVAGVAVGGWIGTFFVPGPGTVFGAAVVGVGGSAFGSKAATWVADEAIDHLPNIFGRR
jgi:hypothetical protein